ncbi:class I SAM-dependent methyltransferase [Glutamicibacter creatinolyticus]|uniref:class I SAM-dependent methyltransferase n=1 Tax=Glutamicibacter creatinolyticus TaxID=162496 RepID=UPI0032170479
MLTVHGDDILKAMQTNDVRQSYAARAAEYSEVLGSMSQMAPQDQEDIAGWARSIVGPIADVGCGPGHWTQFLADRGADVIGVDFVDEFLDIARSRFPQQRFMNADLASLGFMDGSMAGLLSWYSTIHCAPDTVPAILREFARVLRPQGTLMLGFFDGDRIEAFPHQVVRAYRWPADSMIDVLADAGFSVIDLSTRTDPGVRPHAAITAKLVRR